MNTSALPSHRHFAPEFDPDYNFCLFRIPKEGGRVIWQITNRCNYSCGYCIFSSTFYKPERELTTEEAKRVILELKQEGFVHLKMTGGEPFTRPDFMEIVKFASDQEMIIDISTNASVITEQIAQALATLRITNMHVSLDGHTLELQEKVRGKNTFERTIRGIRHLVTAGLYVRIGCLLYKNNERSIEDVVRYCADLGVQEVIFSYMEPVGKMRGDRTIISTRGMEELKREISGFAETYKERIKVNYSFTEPVKEGACGTCPGNTKFLYITNTGQISPCTWVAEHVPEFVSRDRLGEHPLTDVLRGPKMNQYTEHVRRLGAAGLKRCPMTEIRLFNELKEIGEWFDRRGLEELREQRFGLLGAVYPFTTENLQGYFPSLPFKGARVLTIGGSGDHLFNASLMGATEVVNLDQNRLVPFFVELKLKALTTFTRAEFLEFFLKDSPKAFSKQAYLRLRDALSVGARFFFDRAFEYFKDDGSALRLSPLFRSPYEREDEVKRYNSYISSDETYDALRIGMAKTAHSFISSDIRAYMIADGAADDRPFDVILLSNLSDHSHRLFPGDGYVERFRDEIALPALKKLSPGGVLAFSYVYDADNVRGSDQRNAFNNDDLRRKVFSSIPGYRYSETRFASALDASEEDLVLSLVLESHV